jgi:uncharacterized damage-inducible protein DinB
MDPFTAHLKIMLDYDKWANELSLKDIESLSSPDPLALSKLSHICFAEDLWLARLLGEDLSGYTFPAPELSVSQCREKLGWLGDKWSKYLESLKDEDLQKVLSYKNTKGIENQVPVGGTIAHVFDHSTYHRGQIATAIKRAGGKPSSPGFSYFLTLQNKNK